jgi:hypothetical protein
VDHAAALAGLASRSLELAAPGVFVLSGFFSELLP